MITPEAERDFLFLGEDKDKQLTTLWRDAEIEEHFPWAEAVSYTHLTLPTN